MGGKSSNMQRTVELVKPTFRALTSNVSMASSTAHVSTRRRASNSSSLKRGWIAMPESLCQPPILRLGRFRVSLVRRLGRLLEEGVKGFPRDAHDLSSLGFIAAGDFQHVGGVAAFELIEVRQVRVHSLCRSGLLGHLADLAWQIGGRDHAGTIEGGGGFQGILQLAHIPGPVVSHQDLGRRGGKGEFSTSLAADVPKKVLD